jgi:hypothetical protein
VPDNTKPAMNEAQVVGLPLHIAQGVKQVTHSPLFKTVLDEH